VSRLRFHLKASREDVPAIRVLMYILAILYDASWLLRRSFQLTLSRPLREENQFKKLPSFSRYFNFHIWRRVNFKRISCHGIVYLHSLKYNIIARSYSIQVFQAIIVEL